MSTTHSQNGYDSDWSNRVDDYIADFRARNNQRNNPEYVLDIEERIAARNAGVSFPESSVQPHLRLVSQPAEPEDGLSVVAPSLAELTPKRNWFGFKQR